MTSCVTFWGRGGGEHGQISTRNRERESGNLEGYIKKKKVYIVICARRLCVIINILFIINVRKYYSGYNML